MSNSFSQVVEAVAGLGKQFLLKLVAAWEELGKQSELMGDKVGVMEMEEAGDAIYPTKSKAHNCQPHQSL